jgi:hypothetical protein
MSRLPVRRTDDDLALMPGRQLIEMYAGGFGAAGLELERRADDVLRLREGFAAEARIVEAQTLDLKAMGKGRKAILLEQVHRMASVALGVVPPRTVARQSFELAAADIVRRLQADHGYPTSRAHNQTSPGDDPDGLAGPSGEHGHDLDGVAPPSSEQGLKGKPTGRLSASPSRSAQAPISRAKEADHDD